MGNVQGQNVIYQPSHSFRVSFDGKSYKFEEAEGFDSFSIGVMEIHDGETNVVAAQSAGKIKYEVCKLTGGAVSADQDYLRQWATQIVNASGQSGQVDPQYKKIVTVDQLDRAGNPVHTYTLYDSFISKYDGGKFDAKANEYRRVMVEITYRYNSVALAA